MFDQNRDIRQVLTGELFSEGFITFLFRLGRVQFVSLLLIMRGMRTTVGFYSAETFDPGLMSSLIFVPQLIINDKCQFTLTSVSLVTSDLFSRKLFFKHRLIRQHELIRILCSVHQTRTFRLWLF